MLYDKDWYVNACAIPGHRIYPSKDISKTKCEQTNRLLEIAKRNWEWRLAEEAKLQQVKEEAAEEEDFERIFDKDEMTIKTSETSSEQMAKAARDEQRAREGDDSTAAADTPRTTDTWEGTAAD